MRSFLTVSLIIFIILMASNHVLALEGGTIPPRYVLASLGFVLEGEADYWKIVQFTRPSPDYRVGDILVKYGDNWLMGLREKEAQAMLKVAAGTTISLGIEKKVVFTPEATSAGQSEALGIGADMSTENQGLRLIKIRSGGKARQLGLQPKDLIVAINGRALAGMDMEELKVFIKSAPGTEMELKFRRVYQITSRRWSAGQIELKTEYSQGRLRLGPGNTEAERAGLQLDDEIISIAGQDIRGLSLEAIKKFMAGGQGEEKCPLVIRRDINLIRKAVTSQGETFGGIGVQVSQDPQGILIAQVMDNWPAQKSGVIPNDIIVAIDGQSIIGRKFEESIKLLKGKTGTNISLTVQRAVSLTYQTVGPEYEGLGIERQGEFMPMAKILPASPAEEAGLSVGDTIYAIEGRAFLNECPKKSVLDDIFKPTEKDAELIIQRKINFTTTEVVVTFEKEGLYCTIKSITPNEGTTGLMEGDMLIQAGEKILVGQSINAVSRIFKDKPSSGLEIIIRRKHRVKISNRWSL